MVSSAVLKRVAKDMKSRLGMVATVLDRQERSCIDAAAGEYVSTVHTDNVDEAIRAVRKRPIHAVLVSPHYVSSREITGVARLVREFPDVPTVALLARPGRNCSERLLEMGMSGVRSLVDLSRRDGWHRLRSVVTRQGTFSTTSQILSGVWGALEGAADGTKHFFETLVILAPSTSTALVLAAHHEVPPSTFTSRFLRAGLPSPKRYLSAVRLVHAAGMLDIPGLSISDVAHRLEYSSPQSFCRHVKASMGMTAGEFRERHGLTSALEDFCSRLILPFRATFRSFHPFEHGVGDPGPY